VDKTLPVAMFVVALGGCAPEQRGRENPWGTGAVSTVGGDGGVDDGIDDGGDDSDGTGGAPAGGAADDATTAGPVDDGVPAAGVAIGRVEANQGVAITLGDAAGELPIGSRNAELVSGRATLVRAEWVLDAGSEPRMISARLELQHADGTSEMVVDERLVQGVADLSATEGAFTWVLAPEQVVAGMTYSIGLFETDGIARDGAVEASVFPRAGSGDLGVRPEKMEMTVVLIPVATPEGSGQPTPEQLAMIEERLLATYPLQTIEIQLRAPWQRNARLSTLDEAFNYMASVRAQDGGAPAPYYHLLIDNSTCCTGADYADWGGIANIVDDSQYAMPRDGITKLYPEYDDFFWDMLTLVHELGHNHGREHAPCGGPAGPDAAFPYPNAAIGVRGWDHAEDLIIDPVTPDPELGMAYTDVMSYCWPQWWSDYSWRALLERVRLVSAMAALPPPEMRWRLRGLERNDGTVTWSWVPAFVDAPIESGSAVLVMHTEDGTATELPVQSSAIADTDIRVLVADPPERLAVAELELHEGTRILRTPGSEIRTAH
jgi:hypothetical protein